MMPKFGQSEKERYILYLFPIIIPFGIIGFNNIVKIKHSIFKKRILHAMFAITVTIYFVFNIYYSKDSLTYLIYNDKNQWHIYCTNKRAKSLEERFGNIHNQSIHIKDEHSNIIHSLKFVQQQMYRGPLIPKYLLQKGHLLQSEHLGIWLMKDHYN